MKKKNEINFNRQEIKNKFKLFITNIKKENHDNFVYDKYPNENNLYKSIQGDFKKYYKNLKILGQGTWGIVKKAKCNKTGDIFAVKIIRSRDDEIIYQIIEEFKHIRDLCNENIIKVKELFIDLKKGKIYLVMEYFDCLELFDFITKLKNYNEKLIKVLFEKLLLGINYLHSNGIIHRDLKPNNILVSKNGEVWKIADFNIAKFTDFYNDYDSLKKDNYKMMTYTGTLAFNAPEIFNRCLYTELVDCWSAGCVLYTMLIGKQPFYKEHVKDLIEQIKNNDYDKKCKEWYYLTKKAQNIIQKLLSINVDERLTPKEALKHPWFNCQTNIEFNNLSKKLEENRIKIVRKKVDLKKTKTESFSNYLKSKTINSEFLLDKNDTLKFN